MGQNPNPEGMTQAEISASYGMPTYDPVDCMNCEYEGYMPKSEQIGATQTCTCPECSFMQPIDGMEAL